MKDDDAIRTYVARWLASRELDMAEVSGKLGRNHAYMQQYLRRGVPRRLPEEVREGLTQHYGMDDQCLRSAQAARAFLADPANQALMVAGPPSSNVRTEGRGMDSVDQMILDLLLGLPRDRRARIVAQAFPGESDADRPMKRARRS
jgi:hypothetical protein